MATFNPLWLPDYGANRSKKPRVKRVEFGDGYEQRVADGINTVKEEWSLTFSAKNTKIDEIDTFLSEQKAVYSFWWTSPKGKKMAVVCDEWDIGVDNWDWQRLSCTFRQVMENPLP